MTHEILGVKLHLESSGCSPCNRAAVPILNDSMKHEFTAIIEPGEKYLIATCPEVPEAHGQGLTREECLQDLSDSIQSVLEYRREEALSKLTKGAEQAVVELA